jgi:Flp pilus assembly protein TadD
MAIATCKDLFVRGRFGEALETLDRALESFPNDPDLLFERASHLFAWGRNREARIAFRSANQAGFDGIKLRLRLAWCCLWAGLVEEAVHQMREAVAGAPDDWETHFGLGTCLQGQQDHVAAETSFRRALALSPENPYCLASLVNCKLGQGKGRDAVELARKAAAAYPQSATAWTNLAVALITEDRFSEALEAFLRARALESAIGAEFDENLNFALCLRDLGRTGEAIELFERQLLRHPHPGPHAHYGVALLTAGRLREGWEQYEFRWMQEPMRSLRLPLAAPRWVGQSLSGKTILLRSEQGVGDVIQFIRYAPLVKALGASVLLELRKGLDELAPYFPGVDRLIPANSPYPKFDYYIPLMSLPGVFGTDISTVPAQVPYLHLDHAHCDVWKRRIDRGSKLNVGLVWAGDPAHLRDRYRSIALEALKPLSAVQGVRFYSLQKGEPAKQVATPTGLELLDITSQLTDYRETAAAISALDLVITVDTSVAHLAGALAKRVWVLLPMPADWRWMEEREDSPWYPTMRLFRQSQQGEWDSVVENVKHALDNLVRTDRRTVEIARKTEVSASRSSQAVPPDLRSNRSGLSRVAETRVGIVQYLPDDTEGRSIGYYGEYLQPQIDLLSPLVKRGGVVVEVGAGSGLHSIALATLVGSTGHVILYEGRAPLQQLLRQNLAANQITNVTIMRRDVASSARTCATDSSGSIDPFTCPETIDELRLDRLDWLKVNAIEEPMHVLAGASKTLWRLRPFLFVATSNGAPAEVLKNRLRDFGYRVWRMDVHLFSPENFYRCDHDIFAGGIASAVLGIPEEIEVDVALDGCVELY